MNHCEEELTMGCHDVKSVEVRLQRQILISSCSDGQEDSRIVRRGEWRIGKRAAWGRAFVVWYEECRVSAEVRTMGL